jgi:hypothetical protein
MTDPASPLDELLDSVRAALMARRRDAAARALRIEAALNSYRRALEQQIAVEFAAEHRLKAPPKIGISLERAAEELRDAVLALPELSPAVSLRSSPPATVRTDPPDNVEEPSGWPRLRAALATQKLVVIGALSRDRSESAPEGLAEHIEWIDTERDGVHALGNLPQRIRQGRVAAVVILDRAVKHKHSEPALAAARDAHVPTAFAGQGGRASLERALSQLEGMLAER